MTFVEQKTSYQWANPVARKAGLEVEQAGTSLRIVGLVPSLENNNGAACDLLLQYQAARKDWSDGRTGKNSPHVRFANADTDEKLVAFVQQFGPVVVTTVYDSYERPDHRDENGFLEPSRPPRLTAEQDMNELRSERLLYRAALALMMELRKPDAKFSVIHDHISEIASKVLDWPRQWSRERKSRRESRENPWKNPRWEPRMPWEPTADSLNRIVGLSALSGPDPLLPPIIDARIVLCELLNTFRPSVYPNPPEFHSAIRYGIRPLLYSILRREFLYPREVGVCANERCLEFFEIERAGQEYCSEDCSRRQRQRSYWESGGKKRREERLQAQKLKPRRKRGKQSE